jgi:hypothetical protein
MCHLPEEKFVTFNLNPDPRSVYYKLDQDPHLPTRFWRFSNRLS